MEYNLYHHNLHLFEKQPEINIEYRLQKTLKKEVIDDKIYLEVFFKVYENIALEKEPSPDLENED